MQVFVNNYLKIFWNVWYEVQLDTGPCNRGILWLDLIWHFLHLGYDFDSIWHKCVSIQYDLSCYFFPFWAPTWFWLQVCPKGPYGLCTIQSSKKHGYSPWGPLADTPDLSSLMSAVIFCDYTISFSPQH